MEKKLLEIKIMEKRRLEIEIMEKKPPGNFYLMLLTMHGRDSYSVRSKYHLAICP